MRIFHYHRTMGLEGGGTVRFVLDLCAAMAARGHEVTLASPEAPDQGGPAAGDRASGATLLRRLPRPRRRLDLWDRAAMRDVGAAVARADVLHLHGAWMPTNLQLSRAARRAGVPYVITPHGMFDAWSMAQKPLKKRVYHALVGRRVYAGAAVVHCTARGEIDQSRRWFGGAPTAVVPPVMDLEMFRDLPGPAEARAAFPPPLPGAPVVLFLSRVHPQKRPEVLIDAVALLKGRSLDCNLFIAGPGESSYLGALRRRAAERAVDDRTRLLGMVTGRLKASLYQLADVFAHPSPQESFGLVLTEAMACGTPAVATRLIDIGPELEASGGAVLADLTAEGFAEVLGRLLRDPAQRARLSGLGRAWVLDYLDTAKVVLGYEALYERVQKK